MRQHTYKFAIFAHIVVLNQISRNIILKDINAIQVILTKL
jgi:hypothetical protein